jgi:hypothetical protein
VDSPVHASAFGAVKAYVPTCSQLTTADIEQCCRGSQCATAAASALELFERGVVPT